MYSHGDVVTVGKSKQTFRQDFIKQTGTSGLLRFKPNSTLNITSETIFLKKKSETVYFPPKQNKMTQVQPEISQKKITKG